jgi:hypothetical protein
VVAAELFGPHETESRMFQLHFAGIPGDVEHGRVAAEAGVVVDGAFYVLVLAHDVDVYAG